MIACLRVSAAVDSTEIALCIPLGRKDTKAEAEPSCEAVYAPLREEFQ